MAEDTKPHEGHIYDVIVIGAGFSGLSCGAGLRAFGIDDFLILEKGDCIGYFWKTCTYDRLHLHTPYHDLPHDQGLVYRFPKYKSRLEVISYLEAYAHLHSLESKIKYNSNVININKSGTNWIITYTNCTPSPLSTESNASLSVQSKYLVVATSTYRCKSIPQHLRQSMHQFNGEVIHSMDYKNASKYKGRNMLVVGNGNSACEICIDAVEHGVDRVTIISRRARHFIPLQHYEQAVFRKLVMAKWMGIFDLLHTKLFKVTKQHRKWKEIIGYGQRTQWMSVDLSEYGIEKPTRSNTEETVDGNYEVIDIGFIPLLKSGRVELLNKGGVKRFDGDSIVMEDGGRLDGYDVVVLCTGFEHGLKMLFDDQIVDRFLYDGEKEKCALYPRQKVYPKTNGFNQALNDKTCYFASFDPSITGGLAQGLWGWQIARNISKDQGRYKDSMEQSHWNRVNTMTVIGIIGVLGVGICATRYLISKL